MKTAVILFLSCLLCACASAPPMPPVAGVLHDELFAPPSQPVDASQAMAISPQMRQYVATHVSKLLRPEDRKRALIDALYRKNDLQLEYDATFTRTASQAFDARAGNCLALVMMTAAMAKELNLSIRYQWIVGETSWERTGGVYISVGHVNITLSDKMTASTVGISDPDLMTIDFIPASNTRQMRTRLLGESTIVAMYLNNRAVEALTDGALDDAYWWAREAVKTDPNLLLPYTTLGVIYRNRHLPDYAEQAFDLVAAREPNDPSALANQSLALRDLGRIDEANALQKRVAALQPNPPYSYFDAGMVALKEHRLIDAKSLFSKEVDRAPYQSEFQFWLAVTDAELHDPAGAADHLKMAMDMSTTRSEHDLYAGKLAYLKQHGLQ